MKLLTFAEMMKQPEGTIAQVWEPHYLGEVFIFGGPCGDKDYIEANLFPSPWDSASLSAELLREHGLAKGDFICCYPSGFGRNGLFETNKKFLVWEEKDRKQFAEWLLNPDKAVNQMNDDPYVVLKVVE